MYSLSSRNAFMNDERVVPAAHFVENESVGEGAEVAEHLESPVHGCVDLDGVEVDEELIHEEGQERDVVHEGDEDQSLADRKLVVPPNVTVV